jgi:hypothetical protein
LLGHPFDGAVDGGGSAGPWILAIPNAAFSSADPMSEKIHFWWLMSVSIELAYQCVEVTVE